MPSRLFETKNYYFLKFKYDFTAKNVRPHLHAATGLTTAWTTGGIVYTTFKRLFNRYENGLYRVNGV